MDGGGNQGGGVIEGFTRLVILPPPSGRMESCPFDRVWHWRVNLPERKGQRCRILARGTMNSALIEFEDGVRHVCSRFAVRKVKEEG